MSESNKYQNGKIYKIWSLETDEIYVGSTCQPLHKRLHQHRIDANKTRNNNKKIYQEMNRLGKDVFRIELIEEYPCFTKNDLCKREGYWIREFKATLNKEIAGRTLQEYYKDNREQIILKQNMYNENNKKLVSNQKKHYADRHKEQITNQQQIWITKIGSWF